MTTATELANMALAHLGQARISDYSERSPAAEHCRRAFDHVRRLCLRDYDWNFAIRRATLTAAETPPEFDWGYEYPLPADCLRVISVNQRPGGTRLTDYAVEGRAILSNFAECRVRYVRDVTDPTLWDSMFASYFCYRLAAAIAPSLRLDPAAGQQMEQMAAAIRDQAREADAVESEPRVTRLDQSEMIEEREGRWGRGTASGGGGSGGGGGTWGTITGNLSDQADLVAALAGKADTSHTHAASAITSGTFPVARFAGTATNSYVLTVVAGVPTWQPAPGGVGSGDVIGPAGATDNAIARFDTATGKLLQNSAATIDDNGAASFDAISISTAPTTTVTGTGMIRWDTGEGMPEINLGPITAKLVPSVYRVYNDAGVTLTRGQLVYISGAQGNRIAVKLASAANQTASRATIGVVSHSIAAGAEGYIQTKGPVTGLVTTGLTAGAPLYLSTTAGQYTQTEPAAPNHGVRVGWVERVHASAGSIFLEIINGFELAELHDVSGTAPATGDVLRYNGTLWAPSNATGGSASVDVQRFPSSADWTNPSPSSPRPVCVRLIGAGGGGGAGRYNTSTTVARTGGGGGGAGAIVEFWTMSDQLTSLVSVGVGAAGAGGAGGTSSTGQSGNAGGDTTFGSYATAKGGNGGGGGSGGIGSGGAAHTNGSSIGITAANTPAGGASASNANSGSGPDQPAYVPASGGAGGSMSNTNSLFTAGKGGDVGVTARGLVAGGAAGIGSVTIAGTNGGNGSANGMVGSGGGGGGASGADQGGDGGSGGSYGGGGGGGGAGTGVRSGGGGNGGTGYAVIITYL